MRKLEVGSLPLPTIYVCSNRKEIVDCRMRGIPYVVWHGDYIDLVKLVLFPTLNKMFPHIKWMEELGISKSRMRSIPKVSLVTEDRETVEQVKVESAAPPHLDAGDVEEWQEMQESAWRSGDVSESMLRDDDGCSASRTRRVVSGGMSKKDLSRPMFSKISLFDAVGDMSAYVDIAELQQLHVMPQWLGDVTDAIRKNLADYIWAEGWNKKLGCPVGNFDVAGHAPNLIILDVSGSIPPGISATMLSLIETLREQADADLIVTGETSGWYPRTKDLPTPEYLRRTHGRNNEAHMFNAILKEHVLGREWGNVISFGDNDCPTRMTWNLEEGEKFSWIEDPSGTVVHHLWNFHTGKLHGMCKYHSSACPITGYAQWVIDVSPSAEVTSNTDWAKSMRSF